MPDHGSSFTAMLSENSGRIQGTIVDDYAPCEALIAGTFSFPFLQFTKVYATGEVVRSIEKIGNQTVIVEEDYAHPVEYEGLMSDDGQTMSGQWSIKLYKGACSGSWTAHRLSAEEKKTETHRANQIKDRKVEEHLI
jgi:hypothetical protein